MIRKTHQQIKCSIRTGCCAHKIFDSLGKLGGLQLKLMQSFWESPQQLQRENLLHLFFHIMSHYRHLLYLSFHTIYNHKYLMFVSDLVFWIKQEHCVSWSPMHFSQSQQHVLIHTRKFDYLPSHKRTHLKRSS